LLLDVPLFIVWVGLLDDSGVSPLILAFAAVVVILFIAGALLVALGPRADKKGSP